MTASERERPKVGDKVRNVRWSGRGKPNALQILRRIDGEDAYVERIESQPNSDQLWRVRYSNLERAGQGD